MKKVVENAKFHSKIPENVTKCFDKTFVKRKSTYTKKNILITT